jgi:hypothetical protein
MSHAERMLERFERKHGTYHEILARHNGGADTDRLLRICDRLVYGVTCVHMDRRRR